MTAAVDLRLSEAGDDAACFKLFRELWDPQVIARFTIDGEPMSKARARFTKAGSKNQAHEPEKTYAAENEVARQFRACAQAHTPNTNATYGVVALFFPSTRQRRDVDNMLKLILDGLTGVAWQDDDQVVEVSERKTLVPSGDERTEVAVYRVGTVQQNTAKCEGCGKQYATYDSWKNKRFCSRNCRSATFRKERMRNCEHCGTAFDRLGMKDPAKFCSRACADQARRTVVVCDYCGTSFTKQSCHVRKKNYCSAICRDTNANFRRQSRAKGVCKICGGPTSKKIYARCRGCLHPGETSGKPAPVLGTPVRHTQIALHIAPSDGTS